MMETILKKYELLGLNKKPKEWIIEMGSSFTFLNFDINIDIN